MKTVYIPKKQLQNKPRQRSFSAKSLDRVQFKPKQTKQNRNNSYRRTFEYRPKPTQIISNVLTHDESITIKKRQAILVVIANNDGTFRLTSTTDAGITSINPGNSSMGWISQVATAYTKYKIEHFQLEYVPSSSTTSTGNVAVYIDYEGNDNVPTDISNFYDQKDNVTNAVYNKFYKNYSCKDLMSTVKEKMVSSEPGFDITYDMGILYVATQGYTREAQGTSIVGILYMTYHLKLMIPQHNNNIGLLTGVNYQYRQTQEIPQRFNRIRTGHLALNVLTSEDNGLPANFKAHTRGKLHLYIFYGVLTNQQLTSRPSVQLNGQPIEAIMICSQVVHQNVIEGVGYWGLEVKSGDTITTVVPQEHIDDYEYMDVKYYMSEIPFTVEAPQFRRKVLNTNKIRHALQPEAQYVEYESDTLSKASKQTNKRK